MSLNYRVWRALQMKFVATCIKRRGVRPGETKEVRHRHTFPAGSGYVKVGEHETPVEKDEYR